LIKQQIAIGYDIFTILYIVFCIGFGIYLLRNTRIIRLPLARILALPWLYLGKLSSQRGRRNSYHSQVSASLIGDYISKKFPSLATEQQGSLSRLVSKMNDEIRNEFCETCVEVEGRYITRLDLSNTYLTSFPPEICDIYSLRHLALRSNKIKFLPSCIGYLKELESLDLQENKLDSLPSQLRILANLKELNLSYNQLEKFPQWEHGLENLVSLNLKHNSLTTVMESLGNMTNLEVVQLSDNNLSFLPKSIQSLSKLKYIDIRNNQLISIPSTLLKKQGLNEIYFDRKVG
jgi:Leucine-rich repeat (LRR) protein